MGIQVFDQKPKLIIREATTYSHIVGVTCLHPISSLCSFLFKFTLIPRDSKSFETSSFNIILHLLHPLLSSSIVLLWHLYTDAYGGQRLNAGQGRTILNNLLSVYPL